MEILATVIKDLETCEEILDIREKFIDQELIRYKPRAEPAFWQQPTFVVSGVVVSFSLGVVVGALILAK